MSCSRSAAFTGSFTSSSTRTRNCPLSEARRPKRLGWMRPRPFRKAAGRFRALERQRSPLSRPHHACANSTKFLPNAFLVERVFGEWLLTRWNEPVNTLAWARLPMLVVTLILGWVVFLYARKIGGDWGGLLCLSAYVSTPTFIVFGPLVLTDLAVTLFCLLTVWRFADLWQEPTRKNAGLFGICLAGALLSKFSSGLLFLAFGAFALSTR